MIVERGLTRTADGASLAWQVEGPPDAPPLLLLQGQANDHQWWATTRPALAEHHRTVTFDYRGTGSSTRRAVESPSQRSTVSFAADAVTVLDALGIDAANVYGTSMGGRVAQMLAIENPHRISHLVLAGTSELHLR